MMLMLLVQDHWPKCSLLFPATIHSCGSWLLAACFFWLFSKPDPHPVSPILVETPHPSSKGTCLLPSLSPHDPFLCRPPLTCPGPSLSLCWHPTHCPQVVWIIPRPLTSLSCRLVPRVDVRAWIRFPHLKNLMSSVLPGTMEMVYCQPTETVTADFLIRVMFVYFVLMRTVVCFNWVVFIPFLLHNKRHLCLWSRGWITIQSHIVWQGFPLGNIFPERRFSREVPGRAGLKLTNDLSQNHLWISNSWAPPSRTQVQIFGPGLTITLEARPLGRGPCQFMSYLSSVAQSCFKYLLLQKESWAPGKDEFASSHPGIHDKHQRCFWGLPSRWGRTHKKNRA